MQYTCHYTLAGMAASGSQAVLLACCLLHSALAAPVLQVNSTVLERSGQWMQVLTIFLLYLCACC